MSPNYARDRLTSGGHLVESFDAGVPDVIELQYFEHALPNAIIPVMTVLGIVLGTLISGLIVVETVFAWPGIGKLAQEAIAWRDYPLMPGWMLTILLAVAIINMLVDIHRYGLVDFALAWAGNRARCACS